MTECHKANGAFVMSGTERTENHGAALTGTSVLSAFKTSENRPPSRCPPLTIKDCHLPFQLPAAEYPMTCMPRLRENGIQRKWMNTEPSMDSHGDTLRWTVVFPSLYMIVHCRLSQGLEMRRFAGRALVPVQMKRTDCGADAEDRSANRLRLLTPTLTQHRSWR